MSETKPVLIVGAGPTGMTAAMELSRFGVLVRLIDKMPGPSTTSRALAVQARTLELLEARGIGAEMVRLGNPARATTIFADGKTLGRMELDRIKSRFNYILLLSQAETERLLREQLARQGVTVERSVEMVALGQAEGSARPGGTGGVSATLRHADGSLEELEASYLVSAEGAHSTARHTLGLTFEGVSLAAGYALADLHLDGDLPDDELSVFTTQHGFMAVFPMGGGHFRFIATDPAHHEKDAGAPTLEELQMLYDAVSHLPARAHDLIWSSRFRINSRMLDRLRVGRVFFGGDSAHVHSPAGGQGMNTGIQDMINLGWKLAMVWHGQASPDLLDTYAEDRLPVIRGVVKTTERATDALNSESALVHGLITRVLPVLLGTRFVQETGVGVISELSNHYRKSPLSRTAHAPGSLRAGDRLPDLEVFARGTPSPDALPRQVRLYELLDPSAFTLLMAGGDEAATTALEATLKPWDATLGIRRIAPGGSGPTTESAFRQAFGDRGSLLLVRPDAYLGFVGPTADGHEVVEWLERWLPVG